MIVGRLQVIVLTLTISAVRSGQRGALIVLSAGATPTHGSLTGQRVTTRLRKNFLQALKKNMWYNVSNEKMSDKLLPLRPLLRGVLLVKKEAR